ncbi:MAG: DNA mismatch repair endonuclease MutL [Deltaproteobacteria bacterium]|nr:DNA mismatch repair endonuclease MutL [Deltaproteobacteria bacterium]
MPDEPTDRNKIRILPPLLAAKIAAGEVVDRPASVVKELMDNSIDAGASSITVTLMEGGRRLIRVVDDGCGMSVEDAVLAFVRHATSKVASEDDLLSIRTMGFRGEALASIASVARVTLRTRRAEDESGASVEVEGGGEPVITAEGCAVGTSVEVKDLFFNTPARLKFLRSAEAEFGRCAEVFRKIALANPDKRMRLVHGSSKVIDSPPGPLRERIADVAGRETAGKLLPIDSPEVKGFIGGMDVHYATASNLYTYVNGRPVRDKTITRAVIDGCGVAMPRMRYPFVVIDLIMDPASVDVNVHPAKTEVRFASGRNVYETVRAAVSFAVHGKGPCVPTEAGVWRTGDWQASYSPAVSRPAAWRADGAVLLPPGNERLSLRQEEEGVPCVDPRLLDLDTVGQLWGEFLIAASMNNGGEFYIIDQHGAAERSAYEKLKRDYHGGARAPSQALLLPERVETTPEERACLLEASGEISRLGFEVVPFGRSAHRGGETFLVKAVPCILSGRGAAAVIKDLAAELAGAAISNKASERIDSALMRIACHSVIRGPRTLSREEGNALIRSLSGIDLAGYCPHGRPVIKRFTRAEVEAMFKRT